MGGLSEQLLNYASHYRKFGWNGVKILKEVSRNTDGIFSVQLKGIRHPFFLRGKSSDIPIFYQIFYYKEYEVSYKFSPKYILDLGANIGLASIYFRNVYPDAIIVAVEPDSENFNMLLKNTEVYDDIHCIKYGVWNKSTNLEIIDRDKGEWRYSTKEVEFENEHTVKAISIEDIIEKFNIPYIDIIKMDIESAEKEVFEGHHEKWLPKVKSLIIELHDTYKEGCSKSLFNALINYNFSTRLKGENIICDMKQIDNKLEENIVEAQL